MTNVRNEDPKEDTSSFRNEKTEGSVNDFDVGGCGEDANTANSIGGGASSTRRSRAGSNNSTSTCAANHCDEDSASSSSPGKAAAAAAAAEANEKMILFLTGRPSSARSRYAKAFKFPTKVRKKKTAFFVLDLYFREQK